MTIGLLILAGWLASCVVALAVGAFIAFGKEGDRRERRERAMFQVVTARLVTDELGPGMELRALLKLRETDAADPLIGRETADDEMIERRSRRQSRDVNDGLIDPGTGQPIQPTGSQ